MEQEMQEPEVAGAISRILLGATGYVEDRRGAASESMTEKAKPASPVVRPETPKYYSLPMDAERIAIFGEHQTTHEYQATKAKQKRQDRKRLTPYGRSVSYSQPSDRSSERGGTGKPESGSLSPEAKEYSSLPTYLGGTVRTEALTALPKVSSDETLFSKKEREERMDTEDI